MFCIMTVVRVRVLYYDSGACTFCIVTVVRVPLLLVVLVREKNESLKNTALYRAATGIICVGKSLTNYKWFCWNEVLWKNSTLKY